MSLIFATGIVGAEARDELIHEGKVLYEQIRAEAWGFASYQKINGNTGERTIPWTVEQEICIALALYARKMAQVSA